MTKAVFPASLLKSSGSHDLQKSLSFAAQETSISVGKVVETVIHLFFLKNTMFKRTDLI